MRRGSLRVVFRFFHFVVGVSFGELLGVLFTLEDGDYPRRFVLVGTVIGYDVAPLTWRNRYTSAYQLNMWSTVSDELMYILK